MQWLCWLVRGYRPLQIQLQMTQWGRAIDEIVFDENYPSHNAGMFFRRLCRAIIIPTKYSYRRSYGSRWVGCRRGDDISSTGDPSGQKVG